LFYRSLALWPLGYPEGALADADRAVKRSPSWLRVPHSAVPTPPDR
jgi:hypothetical protein